MNGDDAVFILAFFLQSSPEMACTGGNVKEVPVIRIFGPTPAGISIDYNDSCGDAVVIDGTANPKARMEKKKNDEETEEWWVQCDKCEAWQHQICALFNGRRNDGGQAEYTCPNCYIIEVERGEMCAISAECRSWSQRFS